MKPIDNFKLLFAEEESRLAKTAGLTQKGILPLHLRKKIWTAILGEEFWPTVLLFRRTKMERFFVEGKHIGLQCETKNGYLIISSDPSGFSSSFYVYIYYILGSELINL